MPAPSTLAYGDSMIEFDCACRQYKFSLPIDMAGGLIQCPRCRRLVDVPTLGEINRIDSDGGYKFEEDAGDSTSQPTSDKNRLGQATRAFSTGRVDDFGDDIDMRPSFEDVRRAGVENVPGTLDGGKAISPKYDPISGELIRPLTVKGEEPKRVLPLQPAGPENEPVFDAIPVPAIKLTYANIPAADISLGSVFLALLRPSNVIVMSFILIGHMMAHATGMIVVMGFIFVFIVPLLLFFALIGHYGNVIDELGPGGRDELPTPMRDASFYADIWHPFTQVLFALFFAYLPLLCVEKLELAPDVRRILEIAMFLAGTIAAPALVLTQVTSGTFENIRPDRVIGVISACGIKYFFVCLTFAAAVAVYLVGAGVAMNGATMLFGLHSFALAFTTLSVGYGVLAVAIYLMHAVCWQLALLYRKHHEQFPWVMQRHIPQRMRARTRPRPGHLISPDTKHPAPAKPAVRTMR